MEYFDPPPLRWTGSKWKLADWIIDQFPPHVCYVEPFAGGASVFFRKSPSKVEVLNDADGDVVNFFTVLRERPDDLIRAIDLTPYARAEYLRAYEPCEEPIERARRLYIRSRQSFGASGDQTGWRSQRDWARGTGVTGEWSRLRGLRMAVDRLKMAQIECDDALVVIDRYDAPETLFYVDPPYEMATRSGGVGRRRYTHEYTDDQHRTLAAMLRQVQGKVLLSGYASPLYEELYPGWKRIEKSATTNGNGTSMESLWLSPNAAAVEALPLFAGGLFHGSG